MFYPLAGFVWFNINWFIFEWAFFRSRERENKFLISRRCEFNSFTFYSSFRSCWGKYEKSQNELSTTFSPCNIVHSYSDWVGMVELLYLQMKLFHIIYFHYFIFIFLKTLFLGNSLNLWIVCMKLGLSSHHCMINHTSRIWS